MDKIVLEKEMKFSSNKEVEKFLKAYQVQENQRFSTYRSALWKVDKSAPQSTRLDPKYRKWLSLRRELHLQKHCPKLFISSMSPSSISLPKTMDIR